MLKLGDTFLGGREVHGVDEIQTLISVRSFRPHPPADATLLGKIRTGAIASQEFAPEHRALL